MVAFGAKEFVCGNVPLFRRCPVAVGGSTAGAQCVGEIVVSPLRSAAVVEPFGGKLEITLLVRALFFGSDIFTFGAK